MQKLLYLLLFITSVAFSDQLIIEPDMGREPLLKAFSESQREINLVMYGFTDQRLLDALISQKNRGKNLKIILEKTPYRMEQQNNGVIRKLRRNKISLKLSLKGFQLIHQKTLLIDHQKALVMTFNFTKSTFKNQARNFALLIDDQEKVQAIQQLFDADWQGSPVMDSPFIITGHKSRQKIIDEIGNSHHTIQVYTQALKDYKIIGALKAAVERGVTVQVLTSKMPSKKQLEYLKRGNVTLIESKNLFIHAKVFIFDSKRALIGSTNLTKASLEKNRELSIITEDKNVIEQLERTFLQDAKLQIQTTSHNQPSSYLKELVSLIKTMNKL